MICIPVRENKMSKVLSQMLKIKSDCIEVWLDEIADLDVRKLMKAAKKPLIFKITKKYDTLSALKTKVDFLDIDIKTNPEMIKNLKRKCKKLIISFHDYKKTPPQKKLEEIIKKEFALGADIAKVSTLAKSMEDNVKVISLLTKFKDKKIIAVCMGARGKASRVAGLILGSYISYASSGKGRETAKGQMTFEEINKITKWR